MHIYEDNVSRKITDDRFRNLSYNYDKEQQELKLKTQQLSKDIENTEKKDTDITGFISNVKKYTEITELSPEILNELIEKQINIEITYFKGRMILVYLTKAFSPMSYDVPSQLWASARQRKKSSNLLE